MAKKRTSEDKLTHEARSASAEPLPGVRQRGRRADESPVAPGASTTSEEVALANDESRSVASPSYDDIAQAAYRRYLERGGRDGQDFDDWIEAERELSRQRR